MVTSLRGAREVGVFLCALWFFCGCKSNGGMTPQVAGQAVIEVDGGTTFQTISGWEGSAGIGQLDFPQTFTAWRDVVMDSIAALGINRLRLGMPSGSEIDTDYFTQYVTGAISRSEWTSHRFQPINDNADPDVIDPAGFHFSQVDFAVDHIVEPLKQRLAARGEEVYVNLNFIHNSPSGSFQKDDPAEYAELILAAFQHLDDTYGWVPDGVELMLEPDQSGWSGTLLGQLAVETSQRLSAAGYTPDFIGPSTAGMTNAVSWFNDMMAVSGADQVITELAYHRYFNASTSNLQTIAQRATQFGIGTAMLEHIGSGWEDLLEDLVVGGNTSWQQFTLAYPLSTDNGAQYYLVNASTNVVTPGSRTTFLGQVFRYVRAGAVRVDATSSDAGLSPVAFVNADDTYVVVVVASAGTDISIGGLPAGTYGVTYTSNSSHGVSRPDVVVSAGGTLETSVPTAALVTVFGR